MKKEEVKTVKTVQDAINKLLDQNTKCSNLGEGFSLDAMGLAIAQGELVQAIEKALTQFKKSRGL